ncbi:unnamed protein product [Lactuca saligna]|uniref:Uncharacterized protein n=1 Tax=Lactuca saligna TaxID=75948 RepID=A0AA35VFL2_LACSI|nr:unnamed protein product [Lactuca saligna]CAI9265285.1 unnamed protein product [Lactuca saligna]
MVYLLKSHENRLCSLVESFEQKQIEQMNFHSKSFEYEIQKLRDVSKERHDLFLEQVTKMKQFVDFKVAELMYEIAKEVGKMEKNYTLLHSKVDVVATAITNLVEFNTDYSTKLEEKSEKDT